MTGERVRELFDRAAAELPLAVVAILLLGTGAEILPPDSLISAGPVKLNLARVLILLAFAALVHGGDWRRLRTGLELPLALLIVAALVATIEWSTEPRFRFLVESVALFYLTFAVVRSRPDARAALVAVAVVAVGLSALTGIAQASQDQATGFYRDGCVPVTKPAGPPPPGTTTRITGTFANPNVLAGHLLLLAPLAALAFVGAGRARLAAGLVAALAYVAVALTYSRAAVLFALLALAIGIAVSGHRHRLQLAAVAAVVAVGASFLLATCGSDAAATFGRGDEWRETFEVIGDNPVRGVGPGRLGDILQARTGIGTVRHAHNLLLTWWAEAGTGALIAWLWLLAVLLWRSLGAARSGDAVARATLVALAGFVGFSMLDHPANVDRVAIAFWVVAAVAAAGPAPRRPAET